MFQAKRTDSSSLLELEAADYFKLDPAQVNMLCNSSPAAAIRKPNKTTGGEPRDTSCTRSIIMQSKNSPTSSRQVKTNGSGGGGGGDPPRRRPRSELGQASDQRRPGGPPSETGNELSTSPETHRRRRHHHYQQQQQTRSSKTSKKEEPEALLLRPQQYRHHKQRQPQHPVGSSTTSTNSLPSISSSPSISPSLVCPHLTLDDILNGRYISRSPHTIGLCDRCKLDPPPNVHSPLSPAFKPSHGIASTPSTQQVPQYRSELDQRLAAAKSSSATAKRASSLQRGYSDFYDRTMAAALRKLPMRDDSIDFYLDPSELRRLQMSPIQRNSVEFIRKYSTEVGRVLKVYKNGQAFEKPLRICITRGEFANLNQLLDHINSRQLIPCGARYLFHLDGQLVYSVNELKHGSSYVVSGTRNFDLKASTMIKEQQKKELDQAHHLHEQLLRRRLHDRRSSQSLGSLGQLARTDQSAEAAAKTYDVPRAEMGEPQVGRKQLATALQPRPSHQLKTRTSDQLTSSDSLKPVANVDRFETGKQKASPSSASNTREGEKSGKRDRYLEMGDQRSRSSENLNETATSKLDGTASKQREGNLSRAKSELSSSALKRKKNVTFMDTGQAASPVMRRFKESAGDSEHSTSGQSEDRDKGAGGDRKHSNMNEIGIQVSDSIDGYLIDLPLPLPKRGEEKREQEQAKKRRYVTRRRGKEASNQADGKTKKIVTITERDLSLDELDQLKDLDHGDHHNELHKIKHVVIKLNSVDASTSTMDGNGTAAHSNDIGSGKADGKRHRSDENSEENIHMDGSSTTNTVRGIAEQARNRPDPLMITTTVVAKDEVEALPVEWQYPGGPTSSATPEERPVSQSEPNGAVHARVTTPTPSLSTAGENNSLSMSYDGVPIGRKQPEQQGSNIGERQLLPEKNRVPVRGRLSSGVDAPGRNFKLTWVNGFTINDLYPDNSTTVAHAAASTNSTSLLVESTMSAGRGPQKGELRLPSRQSPGLAPASSQSPVEFRPSERFRNWICHSRLHDELIYPAGCLVVLWCRWTNEQRYYARHLTNISAISLAPTQPDVVVSAEVGGLELDRATVGAVIHLWSSTSLQTLMVVDEPVHFKSFTIFSLNLRKLASEQKWSLLVGSKDDRQTLQLLSLKIDLLAREEVEPSKQASSRLTIIKATRVLQASQIPLLVTHVPIVDVGGQSPLVGQGSPKRKAPPTANQANSSGDLLLSFGRRHFQLWSPDWPRQKLQLLQAGEKSTAFVELMTRANCLARLAPTEFLVGDSNGNINLIIIDLPQQGKPQTPSRSPLKLVGPSTKSTAVAASPAGNRYNLEIVYLVEQPPDGSQLQQSASSPSRSPSPSGSNQSSSITSLTRISGSIFASGHSDCVIRFWKIDRSLKESAKISCRQLTCMSLPPDLGFICSIVSSGFNRKQSIVEFYLISTSNAILFGSIQLASLNTSSAKSATSTTTGSATNILANSWLTVVYEGHESSVTNLVADSAPASDGTGNFSSDGGHYFTCSLDFKICKWKGKSLVWKSMLPSACVSMAVHPTGSVLAIGTADGTVYVLDRISGLLISYFPLTPVCINCLSYSCDGTLLSAGCSNGSIFILPVRENGLEYKKVSIFQSPFPVVSLQFSLDNRYLLTSVTHSQYQDLILWDLPNFRYMRDNVKMVADKISWFEPVCSGSEDVRAIWENVNLTPEVVRILQNVPSKPNRPIRKRPSAIGLTDQQQQQQKSMPQSDELAINLSCHRLITEGQANTSLCIASDTRGYLRLFRYPCRDIEQAFYQARVTSSRLNCCRFLAAETQSFVSSALDGTIFLWTLD